MPRLTRIDPPGVEWHPLAADRVTLGAPPDDDVALEVPGCPAGVCALEWTAAGHRLVPTGPLRLNGRAPEGPVLLAEGDVLEVAGARYRYDAEATRDALTGLACGHLVDAALRRLVAREDAQPTLLCVALDRLEQLDDPAHEEHAVVAAARALQAVLPAGAHLGRDRGGAFRAALDHSPRRAEALARRLCEKARATRVELGGGALELSLSVGLATSPPCPRDADALRRAAEDALRRAARRGGGQALWAATQEAPPAAGAGDVALPFVLSPDGLGLLSVVERLLQCTQGLGPFLDLLLALLVEHTKAERGLLLLPGPDGELTVAALRAIDPAQLETPAFQVSRGLVGEAARRREPVLVRDALDDARYRDRQSVVQSRLRSALVVPLVLDRRTVGVLYLDNTSVTRCFTDVDQRLLVAFAGLVAGPLEQTVRLERRAARPDTPRAGAGARPPGFDAIVGQSRAIHDLLASIARLGPSDLPVVILGESGTGKELVARALHAAGPRPQGPFQAESCSALPDALVKSLLCGHERGAFSGADEARPGLFELADGGTLFLDDVDAMSEAMQVELLRVLQEGEVRRLGAARPRSVRVRVVCATRRPLDELVAEGALREDLLYRLNVLPLRVPPLRERREDVPLLLAHFAAERGAGALSFSTAARRLLCAHEWPGNVRQLENEVRRLAALLPAGAVVEPADLDPALRGQAIEEGLTLGEGSTLKDAVEGLERRLIAQALERAHGNRALAARVLGLSRSGLHLKLQRYGLE